MNVIDSFYDGREHTPLSNFYPSPFYWAGWTWPNVENPFQAGKCQDVDRVKEFVNLTPGQAKRLGRQVELRPNWEAVKIGHMRNLLRLKFAAGTELATYLLDTGDALLIEGNTWGDKFWGQVNGVGENWLGFLLMGVRAELRAKGSE